MNMNKTTKTRVTEISPGDLINFDAHSGLSLFWDNEPGTPFSEWRRPSGVGRVVAVESATLTDNGRRRSYVKLSFESDTMTLFKGSKLPVVDN